jgi:hypothetical protein
MPNCLGFVSGHHRNCEIKPSSVTLRGAAAPGVGVTGGNCSFVGVSGSINTDVAPLRNFNERRAHKVHVGVVVLVECMKLDEGVENDEVDIVLLDLVP